MDAPESIVLWEPGSGGAWTAQASAGATATARPDGDALRLDVTLRGHGSWAILRHERPVELPPYFVGVLAVRSTLPPTELQVKLVDPSGANVWWWRRPFAFTGTAQRLHLRRASLAFAWGPASGGDPSQLGAVEIALAADDDRAGTLWMDGFRIEPRPAPDGPLAIAAVVASSASPGCEAAAMLQPPGGAPWRPAAADAAPSLVFDLGARREFGGLVVDAAGTSGAPALRLATSDDGRAWTALADSAATSTQRSWLRSDDAEARWVRLEFPAGVGAGIHHVAVVPLELAVSPSRYAAARARAAPRGHYPRHLLGEQGYWAVAGTDGAAEKALLGEDGAVEVKAEGFTLEPFLRVDDRLFSWADVESRVSLADGHLPIPSVTWRTPNLQLAVTAWASGDPDASTLLVRYRLESADRSPLTVRLVIAIRPYQVNPSWQSLNLVGGMAPITALRAERTTVHVNGTVRVLALSDPGGFGAIASEVGLDALLAGSTRGEATIEDPIGLAEGALWFDVTLAPGDVQDVGLAIPYAGASLTPPAGVSRDAAARWLERSHDAALVHWRRRLAAIPISLPPPAAAFADTLRASIAWILVNRDGPRIQPGPRCYRRSWIRDGTLTGTALAELGFADEARAFLRWYAPFQFPDGRVPCAVDRHGIDPVPEHDSHGQLVWGVVELYRLTGDRAVLDDLWPRVVRAAEAILTLRAERTANAQRGTATYGLLPESISHEGYASRPVHSYWDDFFAVRALTDAGWAAAEVGDAHAAARFTTAAEAMGSDCARSIGLTMAAHGLTVLPGSVELGDFDPTSSAIAFDPCDVADLLPPDALAATFERYWQELEARRQGRAPNEAYTPYEVRTATALLQLGWRDRALSQLAWLIDDQRPPSWRQWPEIAWRDQRAPRFFGDLPHGWVASSFLRALRRLIAGERSRDRALVIAAGVPLAWVRAAPGIRVRGLPTHFGSIDYAMTAEGDEVVVQLGGTARPPGGIVVVSPDPRPLRAIAVDGRERAAEAVDRVHLPELAAELRLRY